ncbi:BON domain-containing protein [Usitatibacter palustris]|uniref:BON domain-containing protein n=1 Tax=Usitatibacter palustris TaxID=2732487 RepID=A0A6M4HD38_9PROT|nr:BON domain-containing protein [Usitatibacter palustris]QJR15907.1 hypothetical protein DSM104440_02733 [Usitatibacter palustris]
MKRTSLLLSAALLAASTFTLANEADSKNGLTVYAVQNPDMVVTGARIRDAGITDATINALRNNPNLTGHIAVETVDGTVKLQGVLATPSQARSALRTVSKVDGVAGVQPELRTVIFRSY